eukprot:5062524-Amphidinium_carterae.1
MPKGKKRDAPDAGDGVAAKVAKTDGEAAMGAPPAPAKGDAAMGAPPAPAAPAIEDAMNKTEGEAAKVAPAAPDGAQDLAPGTEAEELVANAA